VRRVVSFDSSLCFVRYVLGRARFDAVGVIVRVRGDRYVIGLAPPRAFGGDRCFGAGGRLTAAVCGDGTGGAGVAGGGGATAGAAAAACRAFFKVNNDVAHEDIVS